MSKPWTLWGKDESNELRSLKLKVLMHINVDFYKKDIYGHEHAHRTDKFSEIIEGHLQTSR